MPQRTAGQREMGAGLSPGRSWSRHLDHLGWIPGLVNVNKKQLNMAIEIVDFPMNSMVDLSIAKCNSSPGRVILDDWTAAVEAVEDILRSSMT